MNCGVTELDIIDLSSRIHSIRVGTWSICIDSKISVGVPVGCKVSPRLYNGHSKPSFNELSRLFPLNIGVMKSISPTAKFPSKIHGDKQVTPGVTYQPTALNRALKEKPFLKRH
jgi:hypothetical protein